MANAKRNIYQKLADIQENVGALTKDLTNPFFKSKYFDINQLIEQIQPFLTANKLILLQPIKDNKVYSIIVNIENIEEQIESAIELPQLNDPQKLGSAITYYRRYTLQSLLGLQAEDDDGNKAAQKPKNTKAQDEKLLNNCKSLEELQKAFLSLTPDRQKLVMSLKDRLKLELK